MGAAASTANTTSHSFSDHRMIMEVMIPAKLVDDVKTKSCRLRMLLVPHSCAPRKRILVGAAFECSDIQGALLFNAKKIELQVLLLAETSTAIGHYVRDNTGKEERQPQND